MTIFHPPRLWGLLCELTLVVAQLFTPAGVGTAQATTTCTPNGAAQDCTVTFSASGAPESWTVPTGVTSATFDLYGGSYGVGLFDGAGLSWTVWRVSKSQGGGPPGVASVA